MKEKKKFCMLHSFDSTEVDNNSRSKRKGKKNEIDYSNDNKDNFRKVVLEVCIENIKKLIEII
jgi:hypothetical protein